MKASLDTNAIIHFYAAEKEKLLFECFEDGIVVDEFILNVELEHHGQHIISRFKKDVNEGKVKIIDHVWLREHAVLDVYNEYYWQERPLYLSSDEGEVRAIALARTIGGVSLITDDTKQYGPYFTLMRLPDSTTMPFAFYEVLFLLYLNGDIDKCELVETFDKIISCNDNLPYELESCIKNFVRRFYVDPFSDREKEWFEKYCEERNINANSQLMKLHKAIKGL